MNNLSIEDIHKIREEHAILTKNMSFGEYKANLRKEVKPILELLKSMKVGKIKLSVVAEPQATYQTDSQ